MKITEIDLKGEHCQECYKEFELGDAIGFRLVRLKKVGEPDQTSLDPVHLKHLIGHSHRQNTVYDP